MKPHIQIIVGTTRPNRVGRKIADWVYGLSKNRMAATYEFIDLAEVNLPLYNEPRSAMQNNYEFEHTKKWSEIVSRADGFIFVTGEYNHGIPASLKNAIDYLYHEWNHKTVAYVGYGGMGATRAVEHLLSVANELRMIPVRDRVHIINVWSAFDENDQLKPEFIKDDPQKLFDELEWLTAAIKSARESK